MAAADWSRLLGDAARRLATVARSVSGVRVSTEILFGNPAKCIVAEAAGNAVDLIVMGSHGDGPAYHLAMGTVAERVVRTAPCPVLTVRGPQAMEWHRPRLAAGAAAAAMIALSLLVSPLTRMWC